MRKTNFANNYFYHIYNRGVDKRDIFKSDHDRFRLLKTLQILNDVKATYLDIRSFFNPHALNQSLASTEKTKREAWVRIHTFCFMPNHFHLLLEQFKEEGISKFLHKISTSYTKYFNLKNERTGRLFEGPFKAILIEKEEYLLHLSRYMHINPIELIEPDWKEKGIQNWPKVKAFLSEYKWSSYPVYVGKRTWRTIEEIVYKGTILSYFKSPRSYEEFLSSFAVGDLEKIREVKIEA